MFTRNLYAELLSVFAGIGSTSQERAYRLTDAAGNTAMVGTSSSQHSSPGIENILSSMSLLNTSVTKYNCGQSSGYLPSGVCLGTGRTEPSFDDYCLSGDIIAGLAYTSTKKHEFDGDDLIMTTNFTITNNNETPIVIGEIGLFRPKAVNYNSWKYYPCLYERTLLDTPLTIAAGGVGQLTYTIRVNFPVQPTT